MNFYKGKTALITGASGGIGYEMAKQLAAQNCNLILVARSEGKLKKIAQEFKSSNIKVSVFESDLSISGSTEKLYSDVKKAKLTVDILINNAGYGLSGRFSEISKDDQIKMIQLNIASLVALTHLFIDDMVKQGSGAILNVASTAAFQPVPWMSVYAATKSFVLSFSEGLHSEYKDRGIIVTALCPGPVATGFAKRAHARPSRFRNAMAPEYVARVALYYGLKRGDAIVVPGFRNQVGAIAVKLFPRSFVRAVVKDLFRNSNHN